MKDQLKGPLLVLLASLLWGSDSLFRFPAVGALDPTFIVWVEHLVGFAILLPWIGSTHKKELFRLSFKEWLCALTAGVGGGAIATVLFTAAFRFVNPSVVILLQKLQPVFTVLLAILLLGERPEKKFYFWAVIALGAGFWLSFPDFNLSFLHESGNLQAKGVLYALGAAGIWSISTVAGRKLLLRTSPQVATFWRYGFGLGTLWAIMQIANLPMPSSETLLSTPMLIALIYLSIATGLIPMLAYYGGLARTPASSATFIELAHPISAVILNTLLLHTALSNPQMIAGGILLFAVTMISL